MHKLLQMQMNIHVMKVSIVMALRSVNGRMDQMHFTELCLESRAVKQNAMLMLNVLDLFKEIRITNVVSGKRAPAADYEDVNTAQWCSDHEDRMNICDGDIDSCWEAGMDLCDSAGDSCFGVMINAGWTQAFRGVRICLSDVMVDKGDWLTRMKISSAVEAADYETVNTAQWCSDHEDRMNICDGDIDSCWEAGMDLCDSEGQ